MKTKTLILIFAIMIGLFSCSKINIENQLPDNKTSLNNILKFNSFDEFERAWDEVTSNMTDNSSNLLKSQYNYTSFAEEVDEFYFSIDLDAFISSEEMMSFVNGHSEYFSISYDEDGDMVIEPLVSNNLMRAFINEDRLFQIGDSVFKVYETATIGTNVTDIQLLESIEEMDIEQFVASGSVSYLRHQTGMYSYRTSYFPNGRRLVARLYLIFNPSMGMYDYEAKSTAQRKHLGTWWQTKIKSIGIKHNGGTIVHDNGYTITLGSATYQHSNKAVYKRIMHQAHANNMVNHAISSLKLTHFGTYRYNNVDYYREITENEVFR